MKVYFCLALALSWTLGHANNTKIEIVSLPAQKIAYLTDSTPVSQIGPSVSRSFAKVRSELLQAGVEVKDTPFERSVSFGRDAYTYDAGFLVDDKVKLAKSSRLITETRPHFPKVAKLLVVGPYSNISKHFETVFRWMQTNKHERAARPWVLYLDNPAVVPQDQLRAEIYWPLK